MSRVFGVLLSAGGVLVAAAGLPAAAQTVGEPAVRLGPGAEAGVVLPQVDVSAARGTPATGVIGSLPPPLPGGQVASGGRLGFLGNRGILDTPFSQTSYTEQYIRDQQAQTIYDVLGNDAAVRGTVPRFATQENLLVRGFVVNSRDYAFDGFYGLNDPRRVAIEGAERLEILTGPSSLLFGQAPFGAVGGLVNIIPKRADGTPLTRLTGTYGSNGTLGGAFDVGRRFGKDDAVGVRLNGAYTGGEVPVNGQSNQVGVFTAGLDYRGERVRVSGDFGYQHLNYDRVQNSYNILSGFAVPKAPPVDLNQSPRWETGRSDQVFGLVRGEYDVTDNLTAYGVFGGSHHTERFLLANPTIINSRGDLRFQGSLNDGEFEDVKTGEVGVRGRFDTGPVRNSPTLSLNGYWQQSGFAGTNVGAPYFSNLYNPSFAPKPSLAGVVTNPSRTNTTALMSLSAADTISVADDRAQLLLGLRAQQVETRAYALTGTQTASYTANRISPAVGLVVRPFPNFSLYVNYAEGLSAGTTAPITAVNRGAVFPPIVSKQTEAGAKLELGSVVATLAVFEIKRPSAFLDPATNVFNVGGEQRNRGVEFKLFGAVRPDLRVLGGVTYLNGVLTSTAGGTFDGNQAPGVGHVQLNAGAEYDLPWVPGLTTSGRVTYTSAQYVDQANTQKIPGWATLDLGVRYRFELQRKPVVARLNVINVTGNNYWSSASQGLTTGTPRTFLFSLSADL